MIKQLTAIAAGVLCIGINTASAQNVNSAIEKDWGHFQTLMEKCDPLAGIEAAKCMEDAKAVFLAPISSAKASSTRTKNPACS
jgi:hypothetical protein